jgi:DNA-binding NarL/FixJ family response regulator
MTEKKLIELYNNYTPIKVIAEKVGTTPQVINNRLIALRKLGKIGYRGRSDNHTQSVRYKERKKQVLQLRKAGKMNEEIADKLGISHIRVREIVSELIAERKLKPRTNRFV